MLKTLWPGVGGWCGTETGVVLQAGWVQALGGLHHTLLSGPAVQSSPSTATTHGCMLTLQCACREETCEQAAVLHYTYNRFEDLKSRRDRCDCAPTEDDAKRCFILPFDRSVS